MAVCRWRVNLYEGSNLRVPLLVHSLFIVSWNNSPPRELSIIMFFEIVGKTCISSSWPLHISSNVLWALQFFEMFCLCTHMLIASPAKPKPSRENTPLSPMSTNESPSKGRKGTAPVDLDSIMPLLFATLGNPSVNFNKMAAMDPEGRTYSTLEHKFRKWRQGGRDIAARLPDLAEQSPEKGTRAAPKKQTNGKGKGKQANVGDEEDEADDESGAVIVKQESNDTVTHKVHIRFAKPL